MNIARLCFATLFAWVFPNAASAQSRLYRDARLEAVNTKTGDATFVVEETGRGRRAAPFKFEAVIREEDMRRELDTGRKTKASFTGLRAGQRVRVTILFAQGFTTPNWATDLVILKTARSK